MTRYFIHKGIDAVAVVIITDLDPKISSKAKSVGKSAQALSNYYMNEFLIDITSLETNRFLLLARVSNYVNVAIDIINRLSYDQIAYFASGNMYIDVRKIPSYGEMSGMSCDRLRELRIDIAPNKRNPEDVLLWYSNLSCQEFYRSAFGNGTPWWHIQDVSVAMSIYEGKYDIHGGGVELIYPHHETILGQLRTLTNARRPVGWWTHVGTVTVRGNKMSNSLSNTLKIRDLVEEFLPNVIKLYFLSTHYREELSFSKNHLRKFVAADNLIANSILSKKTTNNSKYSNKIFAEFQARLDNDFDTPGALSILMEGLANGIDRHVLEKMTNIFGLCY
jgi:cysteinyl-tRNA synthetase